MKTKKVNIGLPFLFFRKWPHKLASEQVVYSIYYLVFYNFHYLCIILTEYGIRQINLGTYIENPDFFVDSTSNQDSGFLGLATYGNKSCFEAILYKGHE